MCFEVLSVVSVYFSKLYRTSITWSLATELQIKIRIGDNFRKCSLNKFRSRSQISTISNVNIYH